MARFTIMKEHLYSIDNSNMMVFDISNLDNPVPGATLNLGWGIETIFPYNENLFIGTQTGMMIYDNSDPDFPTHLSTFEHIRSCDPVVVQDNIAYVTLRSGTRCFGDIDELEIIDVTSLQNPQLITTYPMENPHGLAIADSLLVICDGDAGIKCYNAKDPKNLQLLQHIGDINAYDVIAQEKSLIVIAEQGLYQYDYSSFPMQLLSTIPIGG